MDPYLKTRVEMETLHELLPELNYYDILRLPSDAPASEVDTAFQRESRVLHPDRYSRLGDAALLAKVNDVYRFLSEARRVLRDPDARARYDTEVLTGARRMSAEAQSEATQTAAAAVNVELAARTPKGEKFWKMALKNWADGNYTGCVMQIQFAMSFEPDNEVFKEWLAKAKAAASDNSGPKAHGYKLRIV